jgi:crotonobetainyl-CoA:carnitine CoA-transferase CaiB-like acyl-CoA transferase
MRVVGLDPEPAGLELRLTERFAAAPAAEWVARLNAAGIGAHVAVKFTEVLADEAALHRGLVMRWIEDDHEMSSFGVAARMSLTPLAPSRCAPLLGADSGALLTELGLAGRFAELQAKGVVAVQAGGPQPVSQTESGDRSATR